MSTPAAGGSGGPDEERKGLSKFVRRASKVFRRRSSTPASASGSSDPTQPASGTGPIKSTGPQVSRYVYVSILQRKLIDKYDSSPPIAETAIEEQPSIPPPGPITTQQPIEQKTTPGNARVAKTAAASITIHEKRARTLFVKYGLTLEPGEWTSPIKPDAERVEKKIRMRVHRQCHKCQTTFGSDRVCSKCDHNRCKKCPRYPGKRTKESKGKGIATTEEGPAAMADTELSLKNLTISSRTTGKQLYYKPTTQRVRRTCHKWNDMISASMSDGRAICAPGPSKIYRGNARDVNTNVAMIARATHRSERNADWIRTRWRGLRDE
ncbi:MAG: hypothetical protein Q9228_002574 [Teloschistes exilis]